MPVFTYVAVNEQGGKVRGKITADNEMALDDKLKPLGLEVLEAKLEKKSGGFSLFKKVTTQDLIVFCIHLEQLEGAGVSILDSIADLRDTSENPAFRDLMMQVHEDIKGGLLLSAALAKHPKVFGEVFTSLIKAGEQTGNLEEIFHHLAEHLKWVSELQRKIKKAMYYPVFLLILMSGVIALMMIYVVPKLSEFLLSQNFKLPGYTTALIATSNFVGNYWYAILAFPFVLGVMIKILNAVSKPFAFYFDGFKLLIPFVGRTIRKIELARFCRFFGIMYRSGIGVLECLETANDVVTNRMMKKSTGALKESVEEGNSLTAAMMGSDQFPNLVVRMFKIGEESGQLDKTIENVNFFYDREVRDEVDNMIGVIQPALTLVMGGLMMWVSVAVFGPLYDSLSKMNF